MALLSEIALGMTPKNLWTFVPGLLSGLALSNRLRATPSML